MKKLFLLGVLLVNTMPAAAPATNPATPSRRAAGFATNATCRKSTHRRW